MKLTPYLLGSVPPSVRFWLCQAVMLALGVFSMSIPTAFHGGAFAMGLSLPASVLMPLIALCSLMPFLVFFFHLGAVWRTGGRAETRAARLLCRLYVPVALVGTPVLIYKLYFAVNDPYLGKSRQAEAKIALLTIHAGEQALLTEAKSYSTNFGLIGFRPDQRPRYAVAIRLCGKGESSNLLVPANLEEGPERKPALIEALKERMQKEDCAGRSPGFAAFAAGEIPNGKRLDIWRIDEKKRLENVQGAF